MKIIPEIKLVPHPESAEAISASGFKWADDRVGKRNKFGGQPEWIQEADPQVCSCGKEMTFYAQLDSIGDDICIADCGMVYVFVCFDCYETKSVIQSA